MELTAEDLDLIVELADPGIYDGKGVTLHPNPEPDGNAPHGMNDEDEMI